MVENIVVGGLIISLILTFIRLLLGPTPQDRVLALDVITVQVSAFLVYWASVENSGFYIDIVIVTAAAVFLTTILFARFIEKGIQ
jgi:multicomponent Na+:H+ antiporter subunit F